jgi:glycosyltransferase involved in cell wall biosynthesis
MHPDEAHFYSLGCVRWTVRERIPLLYTLYTGAFYGTERMSLATAWGLRDEFDPVIVAPPGPAATEARKIGLAVVETASVQASGLRSFDYRGFGAALQPYLARHKKLAFLPTHAAHSLAFSGMNLLYRRRAAHIHVVHGFDEDVSYGQLQRLNPLPVTIVAVSAFTREVLIAHGVRDAKIRVIENFLPPERVAATPRRGPFREPGVRRAAVIGRLVPEKRIDVLLAALEERPDLKSIAFHIYGTGSESEAFKARAAKSGLNVVFEGFRTDVAEQLAQADLLVALRPDEHLPLSILEAMAADVPVIVPDRGGAGSMIENGVSGLHFAANDATSLGASLAGLCHASPERLNALVSGARAALARRFSQRERLADYRALIWAGLGVAPSNAARTAP